MRKSLVSILLLSLVISACNLPFPSQTAAPTPTVDILGTQVALRLTAAPNSTKAPTSTAFPILAGTSTLPASTSAPTNTLLPPTNTPTSTNTPVGPTSAIPTSTLTPTGIPGDPRTALGDPFWKDNFQKATNWGLTSPYDDGHTRVSIQTGKIILASLDANNWRGWRIQKISLQDFYLEATIKPLTCSGSDLYGLVFRATPESNGYWFGVTCDGSYQFQTGGVNGFTDVIKAKPSAAILSGSNQVNRLGVMAKADKISLYMNGKLLETITSSTYPNSGVFGYFIAGSKTPGFTYESTEIAYWNLP